MNHETQHSWLSEHPSPNWIQSIKQNVSFFLSDLIQNQNTKHVLRFDGGMDEYYVSAPHHQTGSDRVFVTPHIDGIFGLIPFMRTWRCIYGLSSNHTTHTMIPFQYQDSLNVNNNTFYCFDYNRELHWIFNASCDPSQPPRHLLKLHFFDYPSWLHWAGDPYVRINTLYNVFARNRFLISQDPYTNPYSYTWSCFINGVTFAIGYTEKHVGFMNLGILLLLLYSQKRLYSCVQMVAVAYTFVYHTQYLNNDLTPSLLHRDIRVYQYATTTMYTILYIYLYRQYGWNRTPFLLFMIGCAGLAPPYCFQMGIAKFQHRVRTKQNIKNHLILYGGIFTVGSVLQHYGPDSLLSASTYFSSFEAFSNYHQHVGNQWIHLLCTSISYTSMMGALSPRGYNPYAVLGYSWLYSRYIIPDNDVANLFIGLFCLYNLFLNKYGKYISSYSFVALLFSSMLGQDLSHWYFDEHTFLSSYQYKDNWIEYFTTHSLWLLPFEIRGLLNGAS